MRKISIRTARHSTAARMSFAMVLATLLPSFMLLAQSTTEEKKIYVLGSDNSLTELALEVGTPKSTHSPGVMVTGIGKFRTFIEIAGPRAAARLNSGQAQTFVLGTSAAAVLPARLQNHLYAILQRFDVNKKSGTREWLFGSTTGGYVYFKNKAMTTPLGVPLDVVRYDDHAIKIQPRAPLPPGEYGFSVDSDNRDPYATGQTFYRCFGVD